jgi:hypothetical protein
MLQGVCVDPGNTDVLKKGKTYFLFPNGNDYYYVSAFPNQNSHKGCFCGKYFQIVEREAWSQEPEGRTIQLDSKKVYKAVLIWRKLGYKSVALKEYYIKPSKTHAGFYDDHQLLKLNGCFPLHWFCNFEEIHVQKSDQKDNHFEAYIEETEQIFNETVHELNEIEHYEQLTLF